MNIPLFKESDLKNRSAADGIENKRLRQCSPEIFLQAAGARLAGF
jgi:hypothetical protein